MDENLFAVGAAGDRIVILRSAACAQMMTKDVALNLAAWLVALADDDDHFAELLERVRST